jgi:hypothetical protein
MERGITVKRRAGIFFILVLFAIPFSAGATDAPEETRHAGPIVTGRELNVTGSDIANKTFPHQYALPPGGIAIKAEVSATSLPGPKGEMARGPRTIGFTAEPVTLALLIGGVIAAGAVLYLARRRTQEEDDGGD